MATAYRSQASATATNTNRVNIPEKFKKAFLMREVKQAVVRSCVSDTYQPEFESDGDRIIQPKLAGSASWSDYNPGVTSITYGALSEEGTALNVDQVKYYAFGEDYIDTQLSAVNVPEAKVDHYAAELVVTVDTFLQTTMAAAVPLYNTIGSATYPIPLSSINVREIFGEAARLLDKNGGATLGEAQGQERFALCDPDIITRIQFMPEFSHATSGGDARISNGTVFKPFHTFDVKKTNNLVSSDGAPPVYTMLFGYPMATEFVRNILTHEQVDLLTAFAKGYRGLSMYGAAVMYPKCLVKAFVTVQ
jgi:hypothetical protein